MIFDGITPEEVRAKYARAQDKEAAIRVLADLTVSTRDEVRKFLGVEKKVKKPPNRLDEAAAKELYDQGMSDRKIAERLNVATYTVCSWRNANGLPYIGASRQISDNRLELYLAGMTDREIGRALGLTEKCIFSWRKRHGLPPNGTRGGDRRSRAFLERRRKIQEMR